MNKAILVILLGISLNNQLSTDSKYHSAKEEILALVMLDSITLSNKISLMLDSAKVSSNEGKQNLSIDLLQKIIIIMEMGEKNRGFSSSSLVGLYTESLQLLYNLYLKTNNFLYAKYTLATLNGILDKNLRFQFENKIKLQRQKKPVPISLGRNRFYFDADDRATNAIFNRSNLACSVFSPDISWEKQLIRLTVNTEVDIDTLSLKIISHSNQIFRCWTDMRMDNIRLLRDSSLIFTNIRARKFINISSIFQNDTISICGINIK